MKNKCLNALAAALLVLPLSTTAAPGIQMPPPGPNEVPDYFGVTGNWATSPAPILATVQIIDPAGGNGALAAATTFDYNTGQFTNRIVDVQVVNGGQNYTDKTKVIIKGGPGSGGAKAVPLITGGVITGFRIINGGHGFTKPLIGSGIRKFVNTLALPNQRNNLGHSLPIAVPDRTTFPDADYYEIAIGEYQMKFHSDLPPTTVRGFRQINATGPVSEFNYLGPVIVAQKDRPVRVKYVNQLPVGGHLPIPVDITYMGAKDAESRSSVHLHGGNTPWISDGTVRQWVKPAGESGDNKGVSVVPIPDMWFLNGQPVKECSAKLTCSVAGATNDPGPGAITFYYTNQQSGRMMFYHDHSEGTTRLNVYAGAAAGYFIEDETEHALQNGGTNGVAVLPKVLPGPADTIPLVIQDKTFVPDDTVPVINYYGAFKSQLNSQDPTWRWGNPGWSRFNGTGNLWVPHVYMPNQNPGDVSGANAVGRYDYGPWFWPPYTGLANKEIPNPYYDPTCNNRVAPWCENKTIPGLPNGSNKNAGNNDELSSPSGTPEAINDTSVVNGTAYPYVDVEPKKYRLRILSVGNDRMLNLSLVQAASKKSPTTAEANRGGHTKSKICKAGVPKQDCTEVPMVPFDGSQHAVKPFPSHWFTPQNGGITFDGRTGGVFDPAARGPAMIQIGTDGGFLPHAVVVPNQPINYEYNVKNIQVLGVKEHSLLLGPAERADVIVDFSQFAGSTLIMYNDSPAPIPANDLRMDYYTGNPDNTDTGGTFSTLPGYGPNTRTVMQFRVANTCKSASCKDYSLNRRPTRRAPVDDYDAGHFNVLNDGLKTAFRTGQSPIIVPQAAYNDVYGTAVNDKTGVNTARIDDNAMNFATIGNANVFPVTSGVTASLTIQPKALHELFTTDYGRMNALLAVEIPLTGNNVQTTIPQAFMDPPTELVQISKNDAPITGTLNDGTQIWKVTHNGVDTHAIHFHLFDVQIINRVGWDGAIYPPDANEMGWKDTVRMNPLASVIVALRPREMTLPFKVPNSHRNNDPYSLGQSMAFNLNPTSGNASNVTPKVFNYGAEYLWHCHILGHEENDMMRTISVANRPEAPNIVSAAGGVVNWNDNSVNANWVTVLADTDPNFSNPTVTNAVISECTVQTGCGRSTQVNGGTAGKYIKVIVHNTVGGGDVYNKLPAEVKSLTPNFAGYDNVTASSASLPAQGQ